MATKKEGSGKKQFEWSPEEARKLAEERNFVHYTISYNVDNGVISAKSRKMGGTLKIGDTAKKFLTIDKKRKDEEERILEKNAKTITLEDITSMSNYDQDITAVILNALPVYVLSEDGQFAPEVDANGEVVVEFARLMGPAFAVAFVIYTYYAKLYNIDASRTNDILDYLIQQVLAYGYTEEDLRESSEKNAVFKQLINDEKSEKTRAEREDVRTYNKFFRIFGPAARKVETEESTKGGKNVSLGSRLIDKYNKLIADGKLSTSWIRVDKRNNKETVTVIDSTKSSVPTALNKYNELRLLINPTDTELQAKTLKIIEDDATRNPKSNIGKLWNDYTSRGSKVVKGLVKSIALPGVSGEARARPTSTAVRAPVGRPPAVRPSAPKVGAAKVPGRVAPKVGAPPRAGGAKGALTGGRAPSITPVRATQQRITSEAEQEQVQSPQVEEGNVEEFVEPEGEQVISQGEGEQVTSELVSQ